MFVCMICISSQFSSALKETNANTGRSDTNMVTGVCYFRNYSFSLLGIDGYYDKSETEGIKSASTITCGTHLRPRSGAHPI